MIKLLRRIIRKLTHSHEKWMQEEFEKQVTYMVMDKYWDQTWIIAEWTLEHEDMLSEFTMDQALTRAYALGYDPFGELV